MRARLARQICAQHASPAGYLPLIALAAKWEQAFAESIVGQGDDRSLAMQPSKLSEFIMLVRERFEDDVFETVIRSSIAYAESAERARSILDHRPDLGADYMALAEELIGRLGGLDGAGERVRALVRESSA